MGLTCPTGRRGPQASSLGPVVQNLPRRGSTPRVWAGTQGRVPQRKMGVGASGERGLRRRRCSCWMAPEPVGPETVAASGTVIKLWGSQLPEAQLPPCALCLPQVQSSVVTQFAPAHPLGGPTAPGTKRSPLPARPRAHQPQRPPAPSQTPCLVSAPHEATHGRPSSSLTHSGRVRAPAGATWSNASLLDQRQHGWVHGQNCWWTPSTRLLTRTPPQRARRRGPPHVPANGDPPPRARQRGPPSTRPPTQPPQLEFASCPRSTSPEPPVPHSRPKHGLLSSSLWGPPYCGHPPP